MLARLSTRALRLALSLVCLEPLAVAVHAQDTASTGAIAGRILRSADSLPIPLALVTLDSAGSTVTSDSAGTFILRGIEPGVHQVHARKVGYEPAVANAVVSANRTSQVSLRLEPVARRLMTVEVNGRRVEMPWRYAGVATRVSRNHGALFTAEELDAESRTRDALQRLPGVSVNDRSVTFARCQTSSTLPSPFGDFGKNLPKVQVYIDGVRQSLEHRDHSAFDEVGNILDGINPASIALMEVYTGIGRIPAEFVNDACAVIAIWTKAY